MPNGRARLYARGRAVFPYRTTYEAVYGPIAPGLVAAHKCHNSLCINPGHIEATTQKVNLNMPKKVLTELVHPDDVDRIRAVYKTSLLTVHEIGRAFGISQERARQIIRSAPRRVAGR